MGTGLGCLADAAGNRIVDSAKRLVSPYVAFPIWRLARFSGPLTRAARPPRMRAERLHLMCDSSALTSAITFSITFAHVFALTSASSSHLYPAPGFASAFACDLAHFVFGRSAASTPCLPEEEPRPRIPATIAGFPVYTPLHRLYVTSTHPK